MKTRFNVQWLSILVQRRGMVSSLPFGIKHLSDTRMILPVKRIYLPPSECLQPIPSLQPNKQFVVSQAPKMPPEQERSKLQIFWYRENLLRRIKATWRCSSTGRQGTLNLRPSLRLTAMQLSILKKEDIEFIVDLQGTDVRKLADRNFQCSTNEFSTMQISLLNRQRKFLFHLVVTLH